MTYVIDRLFSTEVCYTTVTHYCVLEIFKVLNTCDTKGTPLQDFLVGLKRMCSVFNVT